MGTYIKYFETTAEYNAYISDRPHFIKPNVSLTVDNSTVHYNHYVPPFCKLILNNGETVELEGSGELTYTMISPYKTDCVSAEIGTLCTSIGGWAFSSCSGLTSIDISNSVTSIGNQSFQYCYGLTSCTIGSGVTSIGANAFHDCSGLTSIDIPDSVTSIGTYVFDNCSSLTSVTMPSGVTSIGEYVFAQCYSLTSIVIPSGVTSIGQSAFAFCSGLASINIPSGVTSIDKYAFTRCSGLTSVTVNATTPPTLDGSAFNDTNNCPIYVPSASVDTYKAASGWSDYASRIQAIP